MGTGLLCWATLWLLGAGHAGAGVSQSPRHRVTGRNQSIALRCDPVSGHSGLYWYRQTLGQGLEFLTYFQRNEEQDKLELRNGRFSAERPEGSVSHLKILRVEPQDSAVYLCASSLVTVWHRHFLPVHKPPCAHFSHSLWKSPNKGGPPFFPQRGNKWIWDSSYSNCRRSENSL
uniref:Immunoglobulin V-set domain-containing protein n=1 Tax=Sus scrofa TaxID=9823 RepID=A0A8D1KSG9_PIG